MSGLKIKVAKDANVGMKKVKDMVHNLNLAKAKVRVGVPSSNNGAHDGDITNAELGAIFEYGAPKAGINEMPWLRNTITENLPLYKRLNRVNAMKIANGTMDMDTALKQLGEMAKGHVQKFVANNPYQIKKRTIARKGSSKALIDSGQFLASIDYEVKS